MRPPLRTLRSPGCQQLAELTHDLSGKLTWKTVWKDMVDFHCYVRCQYKVDGLKFELGFF